ncbi:MAG: glycine cleavage system aminomethyltransferase GcvT [Bacteroidia bacterium]|nr:glycine cleavage system aminomethyltransferase GcvT [Bacteroidia bacterium]MCC6768595.1 glycine cleavage system aminomethyltransferase GcvT [Bacteroidia bacterium]
MEATVVKQTPFHQIHINLGARMLPFAGYDMPITYAGVIQEHECVRSKAGVFDVSHMGEFILRGPHALDLIQLVTSNDASVLTDGKVQYSCMPNQQGGIVDDLLVYRIREDQYMLVVNASNIEKDWDWIKKHDRWGVDAENISDQTALLAVQGPKASEILQKLTDLNLSEMAYYTFAVGQFAGIDNVLISATGYTGAGGFEVYFKAEHAEKVWNAIFDAGASFGIEPVGLASRDTLRLEMGFCLYGNDIDDTTSPLEAGLGWITKFNKDFISKQILEDQKKAGIAKRLVGFELLDKGVPRQGYQVCDAAHNVIGRVTSGTMSPSLKKAIGLAYVPATLAAVGTEIFIEVREKLLKAQVVKLPFYKAG